MPSVHVIEFQTVTTPDGGAFTTTKEGAAFYEQPLGSYAPRETLGLPGFGPGESAAAALELNIREPSQMLGFYLIAPGTFLDRLAAKNIVIPPEAAEMLETTLREKWNKVNSCA